MRRAAAGGHTAGGSGRRAGAGRDERAGGRRCGAREAFVFFLGKKLYPVCGGGAGALSVILWCLL